MSLLSHSFSTLSQCVPLRVDFVYITLLLRKANSCYAIMMPGPPIRLFNSKECSKEEIDHIWQQQRCNCKRTHVILFVFPGLLVVCWYGHTKTYSTELAVVKAQELKWTQTPISLSASFINLDAWNHCPGHQLSRKRTIWSHMLFLRYSQDICIKI